MLRRAEERLKPVPQVVPAAAASAQTPVTQQARLPEIKLPSFSGEYKNWPHFKAVYQDMVMKRQDISETTKLHYLKTAVAKTPADIISNITPSEGSLETAWSLLTRQFENNRLIAQSHIDRLCSLPKCKPRHAASLHSNVNTVREARESLKLLKISSVSECILANTLVQSMDEDSREKWGNLLGDTTDYPTVDQVLEFMSTRARTLDGMGSTPQQTSATNKPVTTRRANAHASTTRAPSVSPTTWVCDACDKNHHISMCQTFNDMNPDYRLRTVRDKALCIYCLSRHSSKNCRSKKRCGVNQCEHYHHKMLRGGDLNIVFQRQPIASLTDKRKDTRSNERKSSSSTSETQ
ncbi:uncharacterized protein LOC122856405 [Aphidius gifuensis]|uniref:uncharacterized protein LOC122856405 n=1 Tax=Aphidius gifuensis TaxID=684658 RepID=UPI001CDBFB9E|nr:uncharacterized protein LOC122856405 [Aphidius gifuensis]